MLNAPIAPVRTAGTPPNLRAPIVTQNVVIVNGSPEILELLETVLDAGHQPTVGVVRRNRTSTPTRKSGKVRVPSGYWVFLCVRIDDMDGFQVLSMLKLDPDTRSNIPVLTYATEYDGQSRKETPEPADSSIFIRKPVELMN